MHKAIADGRRSLVVSENLLFSIANYVPRGDLALTAARTPHCGKRPL